ncbi:sulfite exporter TauE/SafE family protein [Pseudomonas sp. BNK-43-a]|uniref:sulfite exporter TauE/SafE family protein n=1 Tax=unclassified Pseudomonas TaxID=196821 RepID=UPI0039BF6309
MDPLYLIALGACVAGFVQGLSGFAFGMVAMSFWAWGLEPRLAASLTVFGSLTGQLIAVFTVRRGFSWRLLWPFVLGGLAGIPLGVWVLPYLDMLWFKAVFGTLLVLWCPLMLLAPRLPRVPGNRLVTVRWVWLAVCSVASVVSPAPYRPCGARCAALTATPSARSFRTSTCRCWR